MGLFETNRPKVDLKKLEKTTFQRFLSIASLLFFIGSVIFLIVIWGELPDKVPAHYGFSGEVTRYGGKWELLILPIISIFLYVFMHIVAKYPHKHNYPIEITEENAEEAYRISYWLISVMKDIILITFSFLLLNSIIVALEWGTGMSILFLPLILLGTGIPLIWGLVKMSKLN